MFPVPDQLAILVDCLDPMEGNFMGVTVRVADLKGEVISRFKANPLKRHFDYFPLHPVVIADNEIPCRECRIPADAAEQFMDGDQCAQWTRSRFSSGL